MRAAHDPNDKLGEFADPPPRNANAPIHLKSVYRITSKEKSSRFLLDLKLLCILYVDIQIMTVSVNRTRG